MALSSSPGRRKNQSRGYPKFLPPQQAREKCLSPLGVVEKPLPINLTSQHKKELVNNG